MNSLAAICYVLSSLLHLCCFCYQVYRDEEVHCYTQNVKGFSDCWHCGSHWPAPDLFFLLAVHVCIFNTCASCLSVRVWGSWHTCVCVCAHTETHCELGRAIGRPGRVIKVKLLPPWLFLSVWWDNKRGSPSLPSCFTPTLPACLPFWPPFVTREWNASCRYHSTPHQIYFRGGSLTGGNYVEPFYTEWMWCF